MNGISSSVLRLSLGLLCVVASGEAQTCDLTLTAETNTTTQNAITGGGGTCTWTITTRNTTLRPEAREIFGDATFMVVLGFKNVRLASHVTCDVTNSIVVYNGADTTGTILGLVCRNYTSSFQSSGTSITIQYPAGEVTNTAAFSVKYKQVLPMMCRSNLIYAVSQTEYSILSPMYPTGLEKLSMECEWYIGPQSDTGRVRVTIETTSTACQDVNVTIRDTNFDTLDIWCPGQPNAFQNSPDTNMIVKVELAKGSGGVQVKYRALEESPCITSLNATTEAKFLTTPGYPAAYPSFTECQWTIENKASDQNTIRLEIVESDMEETEGCKTDALIIKNGFSNRDPVIATTCGAELKSFYVYERWALVIFRSTRASNTRKGIKLKYYLGPAEPCGGNLTANSSNQTIQSPGFPFAYPNSIKCVWTITAANPDNFVIVEFLFTKIFSAFSSCRDGVSIYDGSSESGFLLGEVCKTNTPTFQGVEQTATVVFKTDSSYGDKGFKLTYRETSVSLPLERQLTAKLGATTLASSRYPGNVKDVDSKWTIVPQFSEYQVLLTFTDLDLGDPVDCTNNYVKVYYGDTSSPLVSTLCGTETGVYMSRDSLLTVVMVTDSTPTVRGFQANYYMLSKNDVEGCDGKPDVQEFYSSEVMTPNYPNMYPNFADCTYILGAFSDSYFLRLKVVDLELEDSVNCTKDFIEVFDGNTTAAPLLARICHNTTKTYDATGRYVLVRFISDSNHGAKGAQISYEGVWIDKTGDSPSYLWVIILVGVLGGLIIVGVVVRYIWTHRKRGGSAAI